MVHYGMPVKAGLDDMLGYSKQIAEINRSYKKDMTDEGEITVENGVLKIKLTGEEFLSGLRKDDKLIPIIKAVVYFGYAKLYITSVTNHGERTGHCTM